MLIASQLVAAGLGRNDVQRLRRHGGWRSPVRGVWVLPVGGRPVDDPSPRQRVGAARLAAAGGTACLHSAAALLGLDGAPLDPRAHISVDPDATRSQPRGVRLHWLVLSTEDVAEVDGIPCTGAPRLLLDAGRRWDREHLVSLADSALRFELVTPDELLGVGSGLSPLRRSWLTLADGRAESPLETRVRLLLRDAGVPLDELQWPVFDGPPPPIARLDLAWPRLRVAVECDGRAPHELPEALFHDRRRQDDVNHLGWRMTRVTWEDWRFRRSDVVRRIRRALAEAA
jgi:hypothetical protein